MDKEKQVPAVDQTTSKKTNQYESPATFETAIDASGFGIFNVLLLLVSLPGAISSVFGTTTMSYILPSVECDFKISLLQKGILNGITYAGMITSAILWGYISDTKGRRNVLIISFLGDVVCVIAVAMSRNAVQLMIFKYIEGFVLSAPIAVLMSYMTEFHGKQHRERVLMSTGLMFSLGSIILPIIALSILPKEINWTILSFTFKSWQVFLPVTAIPSLLAGILLFFFPESPKFLMSQGRNAEALKVFQKIYAINKREQKKNFPIRELINEQKSEDKTVTPNLALATKEDENPIKLNSKQSKHPKSFHDGIQQLRPLFTKPYLGLSLQVYLMNFGIFLGQNTMRLWLPQLFVAMNEYQYVSNEPISMCNIIEYSVNKTLSLTNNTQSDSCTTIITIHSYLNNIIVSVLAFIGYIIIVKLINYIDSKRILTGGLLIAGICAISLYWSSSPTVTLIIAAVFNSLGSIACTTVVNVSVNLFPTAVRTMVIALGMLVGRLGSLIGNTIFPTLMAFGCIPPFLMLSGVMLLTSLLSAFLPKSNKESLK